MNYLKQRLNGHGGIILLDALGRFGIAHNTPRMAWALRTTQKPVSYTHLDVYKRQAQLSPQPPPPRFIMPEAMTEEIKKKLQEELNTLEHELAFDIPRELKKAVALGDLSENAEYHTAKQRQEYLKARVRQLGQRLSDLAMINTNNIPRDRVGLGSTVTIFDGTKNEEMEYKLVTSEESDVAAGKISTTSPIGRALLNKKVGETAMVVTPGGNREMEVLKLSTMHDLAEAKLASEAKSK